MMGSGLKPQSSKDSEKSVNVKFVDKICYLILILQVSIL